MTPEQASDLLQFLLPQIVEEGKTTARVLGAVPDDQAGYKPADKNMSALELAAHIATVEAWFVYGIEKGEFSASEDIGVKLDKPSQVAAWYEKILPQLVERVQALPPAKLVQPIPFFGIANLPAVAYLNLLIKHSVHHRGQLSAYLRPMGAKVPAIYGGSADEPFEAPAAAAAERA